MKMYSIVKNRSGKQIKPIKIKLSLEEQRAIVLSKYKKGAK